MPLARRNDGCQQCRNRRICCDKAEPECEKCLKKGLKCSGQGIECRFSRYMKSPTTPRRKKTDPKPPSAAVSKHRTALKSSRPLIEGRRLSLASSSSSDADSHGGTPPATPPAYREMISATRNNTKQTIIFADNVTLSDFEKMPEYSSSKAVVSSSGRGNNQLICSLPPPSQNLESVPARARMLFSHFESFIAAKMVVLDFRSNGYRSVLLPLACQSDMVKQAVSAVSAFHLSQEQPELRMEAETRQQKILTKLRQSSSEAKQAPLFSLSSWATILTLLVGDTITGSSNYIYLIDLLSHLAQACAQDETLSADTKKFIREQTQLFEVFGLPLANKEKALKVLAKDPEDLLTFMTCHPSLNIEHDEYDNIMLMKEVMRQACDIYRNRAMGDVPREASISSVEVLRRTALKIDPSTAGAHALVWPFFIAAAESITQEHQDFFYSQLENLFPCTRFGTIPLALQTLKYIWAKKDTTSWTTIITEERPLLIL